MTQTHYVARFATLAATAQSKRVSDVLSVASDTLQGLIELNFITVSTNQWQLTQQGAAFVNECYEAAASCKYLDTDIEAVGFAIPAFLVGLFAAKNGADNDLTGRLLQQGAAIKFPAPSSGMVYSKEDVDDLVKKHYSWMSHLVPYVEEIAEESKLVINGNDAIQHGPDMANAVYEICRRLSGETQNMPLLVKIASGETPYSKETINTFVQELFDYEQFEDADYFMMLVGFVIGIFA